MKTVTSDELKVTSKVKDSGSPSSLVTRHSSLPPACCPHGHPWDEDSRRPKWFCRACDRERHAGTAARVRSGRGAAPGYCKRGHLLAEHGVRKWECLWCRRERNQRVRDAVRGAPPAAANGAKTHCPHGHEYTPENTYHTTAGRRYCAACQLARKRRLRARRREERLLEAADGV